MVNCFLKVMWFDNEKECEKEFLFGNMPESAKTVEDDRIKIRGELCSFPTFAPNPDSHLTKPPSV
jgi:hypothetical protein